MRRYVASLVPYDFTVGAPGVHRGLPSAACTFVLPVGEPLAVSWAGAPGSRRELWSCVSGLHTRPSLIHHGGSQRGVQVGLTTDGVRALLGLPMAALAGELLELGELGAEPPEPLRHLPEELAEGVGPADWARTVWRRFGEALAVRAEPVPQPAVGRALAALTRGASVQSVAEETGYSRRHVTALVRAECGVGAKAYQRIARFESSRESLIDDLRRGGASLADIAYRHGYADQAHLTREWVRLAGCTPSRWIREEFPNVQEAIRDEQAS